MFYYDEKIKKYEKDCSWDESLLYLENSFLIESTCEKLNSLVGFSWYYLIEGPVDSGKYEKDENHLALDLWKKYLGIGLEKYINDPRFCFVAGYTVLLHGFYIESYQLNYESLGLELLARASMTLNPYLKETSCLVIDRQHRKKHTPIGIDRDILLNIFSNDSLLEKYFIEVFSSK